MSLSSLHLIGSLLLTLVFSLPAQANLGQLLGTEQNTTFLSAQEAFRFSGRIDQSTAVIEVRIAPEHYLYKHQFSFTPISGIQHLGAPVFSESEQIYDPYYNKNVDIFKHDATIRIPVTFSGSLPEIQVGYQGCAEAGLCYPPEKIAIPLVTLTKNEIPVQSSAIVNNTFLQQLEGHSLPIVLLLFALAGIGLSLTPCVLPMFPILSSLILGSQTQRKARTLALTLTYILAMSTTFAIAGTVMGLFGASLNLQAQLQSPWLLIPMAALFVLLALSMFGLYELQLPSSIRDKLNNNPQKSGSLSGAAIMGLLSALVVSPCVSAPLAGALLYISTTGDVLFGGLTLFFLGLGMGIPLFIVAIGGRHWLPKSGNWMNSVRSLFGVLLMGVAIWMLERVIAPSATLFLWGALLIGSGVFLGALRFNLEQTAEKVRQSLGVLCLIYGSCLIIGAAMGNSDPLKPLFTSIDSAAQPSTKTSGFTTVTSVKELNTLLAQAAQNQQPAMVDLYADWCISCKIIERTVFPDPLVAEQLAAIDLIKLDITENTKEHQQILNQYQLFGPPALLFFNSKGQELPSLRSQGEITAPQLLQKLTKL